MNALDLFKTNIEFISGESCNIFLFSHKSELKWKEEYFMDKEYMTVRRVYVPLLHIILVVAFSSLSLYSLGSNK